MKTVPLLQDLNHAGRSGGYIARLAERINAKGIRFSYPARPVLKEVELQLEVGELLGLVGPNGAGKTTLLNVLTGYLPAEGGTIVLNGKPLSGFSRREIGRQIALVPQQVQVVFEQTVLQVVLLGRHPYSGFASLDTGSDVEIANDAMRRVGLPGFQSRLFDQLSGGEQRLVLIARALAQQSPILFLDEPLAGLDLAHQRTILELMKELIQEGTSLLATFHDLNAAARWCDRVALLDDGKISAVGRPDEVLTEERVATTYGTPVCWSTSPHLDLA